jgi:Bacterial Ig-like domain (group 2)
MSEAKEKESEDQVTPLAGTLVSIIVEPEFASMASGEKAQFTAMGNYTSPTSTQDITSTATWTSSLPSVATVSATGLATGVAVGTTTIKAASGAISGSSPLTITPIYHSHIPPPIVMNTPLGHLKFRQAFVYNFPSVVAGPDPHEGHINYVNGATVILQPKPRDALQNVIEIRADVPSPGLDGGQEGRMLKDAAFPIKKIVESSTSSDSTAGIWTRGKYFAKKIKF